MSRTYRGTKEYLLIYSELIRAAQHHGVVTYQELADLVGLPLQGSYMGNQIGAYVGAISADEIAQGRPMLSSIVVGVSGKPGGGFFGLAKDLGRFASDDLAEQDAFWQAEKKAVYETWKKSLHKS